MYIKGKLMQIWKSVNVKGFKLKHLLRFEISACEICENVYLQTLKNNRIY